MRAHMLRFETEKDRFAFWLRLLPGFALIFLSYPIFKCPLFLVIFEFGMKPNKRLMLVYIYIYIIYKYITQPRGKAFYRLRRNRLNSIKSMRPANVIIGYWHFDTNHWDNQTDCGIKSFDLQLLIHNRVK